MGKRITDNQVLGELGETAVKKIVPEMQFIYDPRGRLEAGTSAPCPGFLPMLRMSTAVPATRFVAGHPIFDFGRHS
jgi:hypothetical protein